MHNVGRHCVSWIVWLRKRWACEERGGFAVGGAWPLVGAPICSVGWLSEFAEFYAEQTGTASERMPSIRLHLLSRKGLRLNKLGSFRACASSALLPFGSRSSSALCSSFAFANYEPYGSSAAFSVVVAVARLRLAYALAFGSGQASLRSAFGSSLRSSPPNNP